MDSAHVRRKSFRWQAISIQVVIYSILIIIAVAVAFPYYWMVITTLKPEGEVYTRNIQLVPTRITFETYRDILTSKFMPVPRFLLNSLIISVGATAIGVSTATLAAYALSRYRLPGGRLFYYMIISTMMVPGETVLIGMFWVVSYFGWINTYQGMMFPLAVNAVNFLIVYNYMKELPKELDEAAIVDGATPLQVLRHVIIPLSMPAIYSGGLLMALGVWQAFTIPYLLAQSTDMYPMAVAPVVTENSLFATMKESLTLSTLLTLPTLIAFVLTQRFVFSGITMGAVKG